MVTHVENGFQERKKSGAVFLDLTCAYDTVWTRGLLLKLANILNCKMTLRLIESMLADRKFRVHLNGNVSRYKYLQNGLPQGSVLSPILFNTYTVDITRTISRKFIYADDVGLVAQAGTFEEVENILNVDLAKIHAYFKSWHLTLNPSKSAAIVFHLSNRKANRKLNLVVDGNSIPTENTPKYLGIKLDRSLTFKQHLEGVKDKLKTRNNIISKLAGTSWGCRANVLRISSLALVYSIAEYCAPVWARSTHTKNVDTQLNRTMRIISGCVKSTKLEWLPVLSHIAPPEVRRQAAEQKMIEKIQNSPSLPIYDDLYNAPNKRLKSRNPIWTVKNSTTTEGDLWNLHWKDVVVPNNHLISDPTQLVPGFEFPRATWTALNRVRTGQGKCNYLMHKWGMVDSPLCNCGQIQTIRHIVEECPETKFSGGTSGLHKGDKEALDWLCNLAIRL